MKALILTNHLSDYSGSEIVALEVAETFQELGCEAELYSGYIGEPAQIDLNNLGIKYGLAKECPDPFSYNIVWSQHQILPYLISKHYSDEKIWPYIASVSLSPFEPYELPGAISEVSDTIIANSVETAEKLVSLGISSSSIDVFYNAAPERFSFSRESQKELKKLLIISNHMPIEINEAITLLIAAGIKVDHIGLPKKQNRITIDILCQYDAVLTIGKSVQYCILSETPVFIYDHFAGPGWLTEENHQKTEKYNFSGRCSNTKITAHEITKKIIEGYPQAVESIKKIKTKHAHKYNLKNYIKKLLRMAAMKGHTVKLSPKLAQLICREGRHSGQMIDFYNQIKIHEKINAENSAIINQLKMHIENMTFDTGGNET